MGRDGGRVAVAAVVVAAAGVVAGAAAAVAGVVGWVHSEHAWRGFSPWWSRWPDGKP